MIEYLKGQITELTPATAVLETKDGTGYLLNISLNTYASLQNADLKADTKVYVQENIREDAWTLYGFTTQQERALFRALVGVSGVGAATARVILSSLTVPELESIISGGDIKSLKQVKGIGAKTAERIIVDLRDKIKPGTDTLINVGITKANSKNEVYDDALVALVNLGFSRPACVKALDKIFAEQPDIRVEAAIKKALSML